MKQLMYTMLLGCCLTAQPLPAKYWKWMFDTPLDLGLNHPTVPPPPANDACANATPVPIGNAGFAFGAVDAPLSTFTQATVQAGEYFEGSMVASGNNKMSVWYKLVLPVARKVRFDLLQPAAQIQIAQADCGFSVYKTGACLPGSPTHLSTQSKFGFLENDCLEAGEYLIQIGAKSSVVGDVFLRVTLSRSPSSGPYDDPAGAYDFGIVPASGASVNSPVRCHSVEGPTEYACLPFTNQTQYVQSVWYVFTTPAIVDLLEVSIQSSSFFLPPAGVGYRLYEGNVRTAGSTAGLTERICGSMPTRTYYALYPHLCDLSGNSTYSIQLLFPAGFSDNITVKLEYRGAQPNGAPQPTKATMGAGNQLGLIPLPDFKCVERRRVKGRFACANRLSQSACGTVNPAAGVVVKQGNVFVTCDLAEWFSFSTSESFRLWFDVPSNLSYDHYRLFRKNGANDCTELNYPGDLVAEWTGTTPQPNLVCLPEGDYWLQALGAIRHPDWNNPNNFYRTALNYGDLGKDFEVNFTFQKTQPVNYFNLSGPGRADWINNLMPLANGEPYTSTTDHFGCQGTVLPESGACDTGYRAMIVREFAIAPSDSGLLRISNLGTHTYMPFSCEDNYPPGKIFYRLFPYHLGPLATAQGVNAAGQTIQNLPNNPYSCITYGDGFAPGIDSCFTCLSGGNYTFAAFGGPQQLNGPDQPGFKFQKINTVHYAPALAENMGDLTNKPFTISQPDYFSCRDNPAVIGGLPPCNGATKLIYREFYLSEPKVVTLTHFLTAGLLRLYRGRVSDPAATLVPWAGKNTNNSTWTDCFTTQTTQECDPLPAGWWTVVAYGRGPSYTAPFWDKNGDKVDVARAQRITVQVITPPQARYNRPFKRYYSNNASNWDFAKENTPFAATLKKYTLGIEKFTCVNDLPFAAHPTAPCATGENRVAYYTFKIDRPSFVGIGGIRRSWGVKLFPFDVKSDSAQMASTAPLYACHGDSLRQFCDLQPGFYTIAVYAGDEAIGLTLTPTLHVDRVGRSRFDYAAKAYDFGHIRMDNTWVDGRPGDVHPLNPALPASHDGFFCTTGAYATDPAEELCNLDIFPNIYPPMQNQVQLPPAASDADFPRRNLWYTFQLSGLGSVQIEAVHPTTSLEIPAIAVYRSDVDGGIPFSECVAKGLVDSTLAAGLTFVADNFTIFTNCRPSFSTRVDAFDKTGCDPDTVRYYIVVSLPARLPNLPFDLRIRYNGAPLPAPRAPYDFFQTANIINGLGEAAPPYTSVVLPADTFISAPYRLPCHTVNPDDPLPPGILQGLKHTLWQKFETSVSGKALFAIEKNGDPKTRKRASPYALSLFKLTPLGTGPQHLAAVNLAPYYISTAGNTTGHDWAETCITPGTYYILLTDYYEFDLQSTWRTVLWLIEQGGNHCENAIPLALPVNGSASAKAMIKCHDLGGDFGENPPANYGCASAANTRRSTFFKITVPSPLKQDVTFRVKQDKIQGNSQIAWRVLGGLDCNALVSGACSATAGNTLSLNCLSPGDYWVQIFTPLGTPSSTPDTLTLETSSKVSSDQNCVPVFEVVANFTYRADCDSIHLRNASAVPVPDPVYTWLLPNGARSNLESPSIAVPAGVDSFWVQLIVSSQLFSTADTFSKWVKPSTNRPLHELNQTICSGQTYNFYGQTLAATGTYEKKFALPNGCDSLVRLRLNVVTPIQTTQQSALCAGESLSFYGKTYSTTGVYTIVIAALSTGCDSIRATLNLRVNPRPLVSLTQQVCRFNQVGVDTLRLKTWLNCDSTVIVRKTLNTAAIQTVTQTRRVCDPAQHNALLRRDTLLDPATGCDQIREERGQYLMPTVTNSNSFTCRPNLARIDTTQTFDPVSGCLAALAIHEVRYDSTLIDILHQTLHQCGNLPPSTILRDTIGPDGCRDVLSITTIFHPDSARTVAQATCRFREVGTAVSTAPGFWGCNTITTTLVKTLDAAAIQTVTQTRRVCDSTQHNAVLRRDTLLDPVTGCDQIRVEMGQYLAPTITNSISFTCWPNPDRIDTTRTFDPVSGCLAALAIHEVRYDSTLIDILHQTLHRCGNLPPSTILRDTIGPDGCRDVLSITTIFHPDSARTVAQATCRFREVGTTVSTAPGFWGCNTITTTLVKTLDAAAIQTVTQTRRVCDSAQHNAVLRRDTLLDPATGCDQIRVEMGAYLPPVVSERNTYVCRPAQVGTDTVRTVDPISGCLSEVTIYRRQLSPAPDVAVTVVKRVCSADAVGEQTRVFARSSGCDSTVLEKRVYEAPLRRDTFAQLCPGETWQFGGQSWPAPGLHRLAIPGWQGCDSLEWQLNLTVSPLGIDMGNTLDLHVGDSVQLLPDITGNPKRWEWTPNDGSLSCTACPNPWAKPVKDTRYQLSVQNADSCLVRAEVLVRVDQSIALYVPNAFSPNDDGLHDFFEISCGPGIQRLREVGVYDRWGNLLFQRTDLLPNDSDSAWDGKYRNKEVMPGVYTYLIEVELGDGTVHLVSGDVAVVR